MGLSALQKTAIRSYFESNYNMFFGIPTERKEGDLTPNEHVMVLQHLQLHLLKLPIEPLDEELLGKQINGDDTVADLLKDFLEDSLSPMKPDSYLNHQGNFKNIGNEEDPATLEEITQHLIEVIEIISQQMEHGYLKKESDSRRETSDSSVSKIIKWGIFGGVVLGMTYVAAKLSEKNNSNTL